MNRLDRIGNILSKIFQFLGSNEIYSVQSVCQGWSNVLYDGCFCVDLCIGFSMSNGRVYPFDKWCKRFSARQVFPFLQIIDISCDDFFSVFRGIDCIVAPELKKVIVRWLPFMNSEPIDASPLVSVISNASKFEEINISFRCMQNMICVQRLREFLVDLVTGLPRAIKRLFTTGISADDAVHVLGCLPVEHRLQSCLKEWRLDSHFDSDLHKFSQTVDMAGNAINGLVLSNTRLAIVRPMQTGEFAILRKLRKSVTETLCMNFDDASLVSSEFVDNINFPNVERLEIKNFNPLDAAHVHLLQKLHFEKLSVVRVFVHPAGDEVQMMKAILDSHSSFVGCERDICSRD